MATAELAEANGNWHRFMTYLWNGQLVTTLSIQWPIMDQLLLAFSAVDYFWDSWYELRYYVQHLGNAQWMILSGLVCSLGFLCLRGNPIAR